MALRKICFHRKQNDEQNILKRCILTVFQGILFNHDTSKYSILDIFADKQENPNEVCFGYQQHILNSDQYILFM